MNNIGWKTITGMVCFVISALAGYFDIIPKDVSIVCSALSGILLTVGARHALAKMQDGFDDLVNAVKRGSAPIILLGCLGLASIIHATDTTTTKTFNRLGYAELAISAIINDITVADSVGDTLYVELYGRSKTNCDPGSGLYDSLCSGYTSWQKAYFNSIQSPDFPAPADYPEIDSIVKFKITGGSWIQLPVITTGLWDQMYVKFTVTQGNSNESSKGTNTRLYGQILQRFDNDPAKRALVSVLDTIVAAP